MTSFDRRYRPVTDEQVAAAREYRALGIAWWRTARLLRVNECRLRVAVGVGADPRLGTDLGVKP